MKSFYRRALGALVLGVAPLALLAPLPAAAQAAADPIIEARAAWGKRDLARLAAIRSDMVAQQHPLAPWADYWETGLRLAQATQADLDAFYARWPGTYVEDRLRNDWLLELGRRRDWANFAVEHEKFRMRDDREVRCYALLVEHLAGRDVRDAAREAWFAQRDADQGCALMAATLHEAGRLGAADVWRKARLAAEANRPRALRQAVAILGEEHAKQAAQVHENPARYLTRHASARDPVRAELTALALVRVAASDPDAAAVQLDNQWERQFRPELAAWVWASIGKQAALRLSPAAVDHYQRAIRGAREADWPDDTLAWKARAALRAGRWQMVSQAINAMRPAEQADPTWVYWKARALAALAPDSSSTAALRTESRTLLESISGQIHFYGQLAAEELGRPQTLPPKPAPLTEAERDAARRHPGLARALQLIALGLRNEGVREWNWTTNFSVSGGLPDRELLAAAQLACEREIWDRCINTSDRTRTLVDLEQRFPMPFRKEVLARTREIGLDPAYVYGLIRQESRFIMDARSHVGASGLMQVMPATAQWTAKRIGLPFRQEMLTDRDTNLVIGTSYLKLVLDDFAGSQPMAAAAYNAGPSRPRRWREGPVLEPAIWAENIPFSETRDYVKKVLSNATYYAGLIHGQLPPLKARLGGAIGPREASAPEPQRDLP
ncbi:lytic transglycosylase domain-containing protein [Caldimonas tepidiphila]|uniref:lytic transglycosylase domain-containing protein n=1 Tax=Caldimonas tepidiphila TaxID=2315841 RepID=UPI000E5A583D|nr:lytic transglycosylase domain-containing protein [Caldimonas tepidiphila]